jgi:hypothetical protein
VVCAISTTTSSSNLSAVANRTQLAAIVGGGQPSFAPLLYKELIKRAEYQTSEQRQALMRRIRETLFKLIVIVGVCKPLEAIFDIDAVTRPEDKDYTFSRYGAETISAGIWKLMLGQRRMAVRRGELEAWCCVDGPVVLTRYAGDQ